MFGVRVWCTSRLAEDRTGRQGTAYMGALAHKQRGQFHSWQSRVLVSRGPHAHLASLLLFHGFAQPPPLKANPTPTPACPWTRCALYIFRYFDKSITTGIRILWEFDNKKGRTQHADLREANLHPILWENNRIRTHIDCNVMVNKANVKYT